MDKINIREIFRKKNPKLAKLIPRFVYKYLERIVHQEEINGFIPILKDQHGLDFIKTTIDLFKVNIQIEGADNIPDNGRNIFVANHPLGGLDGIAFAHIVGKKHSEIKFLVNDILMNLENLNTIFIPVNKHGKQSIAYVKKIETIYESDFQVLNFPAGLCSRRINNKIIDLEWKKSFITKAIQHKRDIIPAHISGKNSNFFYKLSNIRKKLGIKANLEMLYLVDEMFKQKNKCITITFGKPIPYSTFDKTHHPKDWAARVRKHIYTLKENPFSLFT